MSDIDVSPAASGRKKFVLMVLIPVVALSIGVALYLQGGRFVETDNAYVKADKVPISAEVSGIISEVRVTENQHVQKGDVLYHVQSSAFEVAVAKAEAKLAQVKTDIASLKAEYRARQAEILLARTRVEFADKNLKREADLIKRNVTSASRFDDAQQAADLARLQVASATEDLQRIAESLGGSINLPVEQHPNFLAAKAELDEAQLNLNHTMIRAPQDGIVSVPPKAGQYLPVGSVAMALVADRRIWVEANFTETDLTFVKAGQPVSIHIDTYPGQVWQGKVESLSPATSAEFSLLPAQNATGNWVKIAQRLPVRIAIDSAQSTPQLRAGLSAIARIDTGHKRQLLGITL